MQTHELLSGQCLALDLAPGAQVAVLQGALSARRAPSWLGERVVRLPAERWGEGCVRFAAAREGWQLVAEGPTVLALVPARPWWSRLRNVCSGWRRPRRRGQPPLDSALAITPPPRQTSPS